MRKLDINTGIKLSVIAGVLLISFSFFYYFVIFLPQYEKAKIEQRNQEQLAKEKESSREAMLRQLAYQNAEAAAIEFYKARSRESPYLFPPAEGRYLKDDLESYYRNYLRAYGLKE